MEAQHARTAVDSTICQLCGNGRRVSDRSMTIAPQVFECLWELGADQVTAYAKDCLDLYSLFGDLWLDTTRGGWDDIFEQRFVSW